MSEETPNVTDVTDLTDKRNMALQASVKWPERHWRRHSLEDYAARIDEEIRTARAAGAS